MPFPGLGHKLVASRRLLTHILLLSVTEMDLDNTTYPADIHLNCMWFMCVLGVVPISFNPTSLVVESSKGRVFESLPRSRSHFRFRPSATLDDVTSVFQNRRGSCHDWGSKISPMSRISSQLYGRSPLAQVDLFHDLVTVRWLSGVTQSV